MCVHVCNVYVCNVCNVCVWCVWVGVVEVHMYSSHMCFCSDFEPCAKSEATEGGVLAAECRPLPVCTHIF